MQRQRQRQRRWRGRTAAGAAGAARALGPALMARAYNFSAGPAVLPEEVLARAGDEMLDWHGAGMCVMEMSHRGKEFISIAEAAEHDLRELLAIPANYKVLFLQGGATLQFAQVPMNLLRGKGKADYVVTGEWSKKAVKEAAGAVRRERRRHERRPRFSYAPREARWKLRRDAAYVHYCSNETIGGVEFHWMPDTGDRAAGGGHVLAHPVAPVDVSKFGLIYAGAQKNIGPAGLTIVIVREDLLGQRGEGHADVMDYKQQAEAASMLNTPPTYAIYIAGLVFKWLKQLGGVAEMERRNIAKAKLLYDFIDGSGLLPQPGRAAGPLAHERAVHAGRRDARRGVPEGRGRSAACCSSRATARSAACAPRSTTPCRSRACAALVEYMQDFEAHHG